MKNQKRWVVLGKTKSSKTGDNFLFFLSSFRKIKDAEDFRRRVNKSTPFERNITGEPDIRFWFTDEVFITYSKIPKQNKKIFKFLRIEPTY